MTQQFVLRNNGYFDLIETLISKPIFESSYEIGDRQRGLAFKKHYRSPGTFAGSNQFEFLGFQNQTNLISVDGETIYSDNGVHQKAPSNVSVLRFASTCHKKAITQVSSLVRKFRVRLAQERSAGLGRGSGTP